MVRGCWQWSCSLDSATSFELCATTKQSLVWCAIKLHNKNLNLLSLLSSLNLLWLQISDLEGEISDLQFWVVQHGA